MDLTRKQHQILYKYQKNATEILGMIRQAFGEESPNSPRLKKKRERERSEEQSQVHAHKFL
jgi:hypothetical protein